MPLGDIIRGDKALEEYLGLPAGALAKRRLQNRPVPPGILLPHAKSRFYVLEDVMIWLRAHAEPDGLGDGGMHDVSARPPRPDSGSIAPAVRRRGRPKKAASR